LVTVKPRLAFRNGLVVCGVALTVACGTVADPDALLTMDLSGFSEAPPLGVFEWVSGDPVDLSTTKELVLVDLWATWCAPCREQLPHLTSLQDEYRRSMHVVGLSTEGGRLAVRRDVALCFLSPPAKNVI
jgi:thiol-disulfide isomerase/thioredoxin